MLMQRCGFSATPHPADEALIRVERSVIESSGSAPKCADSFFGALGQSVPQWLRPARHEVPLDDFSVR